MKEGCVSQGTTAGSVAMRPPAGGVAVDLGAIRDVWAYNLKEEMVFFLWLVAQKNEGNASIPKD